MNIKKIVTKIYIGFLYEKTNNRVLHFQVQVMDNLDICNMLMI